MSSATPTGMARVRAKQNIIAAVLAAVLLSYFPAKWALTAWHHDTATVAANRSQAAQLNAKAAGVSGFNQGLYYTKTRFYSAEVPQTENLPQLISELQTLTADAHLTWPSGAPATATNLVSGGPKGQWTMSMQLQGSATGVITFLHSLTDSQRLIVADSVQLSGSPNNLTASVTVRFFAQQAHS